MSKKIGLTKEEELQDDGTMMTEIFARLGILREAAYCRLSGDKRLDVYEKLDIAVFGAVIDILDSLYDEGICTLKQVRDLVSDYSRLHQKLEVAGKPNSCGGMYFCPECHKRNQPGHNHCWYCGKRLSWGSTQQEPADAVGGNKLQSPVTQTSKLSLIPTCVLVEDLKNREGVEVNTIGPTATASLSVDGPAIILTVID